MYQHFHSILNAPRAFFVLSVSERIDHTVPYGILGVAKFFTAPASIAFGGFDHPFAATLTGGGVSGSWHWKLRWLKDSKVVGF